MFNMRFSLTVTQVSEELARLRTKSHTTSASSPAVLIRRIEGERDDIRLELRQVKVECQSLRDRLKGLQDGHHCDLAGLEDRIAELQLQLDEVSSERGCGLRATIHCITDEGVWRTG